MRNWEKIAWSMLTYSFLQNCAGWGTTMGVGLRHLGNFSFPVEDRTVPVLLLADDCVNIAALWGIGPLFC